MRLKNYRFWLAAIIGLLLDRLTKALVMQQFALGQSLPLWPNVFHLTYVLNTGAAFSLFQGHGWLRWLSLLVSLALMGYAFLGPTLKPWEDTGLGFILAGAMGNGIDRFATGAVVDFLDLRLINFPVFNIADVSINLGVACILIAIARQSWEHRH